MYDTYGRPQFDDRDAADRLRFIAKWDERQGPRVGDFLRLDDDNLLRFTHHWGDSIQTTCHPGASGSFYGDPTGFVSFSGSLDPAIPLERIKPTPETRDGRFWFFHHQSAGAHRGVYFTAPCRVFNLTD